MDRRVSSIDVPGAAATRSEERVIELWVFYTFCQVVLNPQWIPMH
jgi:hypothetical protein